MRTLQHVHVARLTPPQLELYALALPPDMARSPWCSERALRSKLLSAPDYLFICSSQLFEQALTAEDEDLLAG